MTLDEKLKEIVFRQLTATYVGFSESAQDVIRELNIECAFLLAALQRCREQRNNWSDGRCDLSDFAEWDAEILALLEGKAGEK